MSEFSLRFDPDELQEARDCLTGSKDAAAVAEAARGDALAAKVVAQQAEFEAAQRALSAQNLHDQMVLHLAEVKNVLAKLWIDVTQNGAVGDKTTDNSSVVQKLFDDLPNDDYTRVIWFPPGFYGLGSTIRANRSNLIIEGPGVLWSLATGTSRRGLLQVNTYTGTDVSQNRLHNVQINIDFDMSLAYDKDPIEWDDDWKKDNGMLYGALICKGIDDLTIKDITIHKAVLSGLDVTGCYDVTIDNVTVDLLKGHTISGGITWGGNAINVMPWGSISGDTMSTGNTTEGKAGFIKVTNCHVYGSDVWPSPISNDVTERCNVGICVMSGSPNLGEHQQDPIIVSGNTVTRCYIGILSEGMCRGGTGNVIVTNNAVKECMMGIGMYPDASGELGHNSVNFICTSNKLTNIGCQAFIVKGENVILTGNIVRDWGMLKSTDVYPSRLSKDATAILLQPKYKGNTTTGEFGNIIISNNIFDMSEAHDKTFAAAVQGIWIDVPNTDYDYVFRDIKIHDNILNGGGSTYSTGQGNSGIWLWGMIDGVSIRGNTIKGFPMHAVFSKARDSSKPEKNVSNVKVKDNTFRNNGCASKCDPVSITSILTGNVWEDLND